MNQKYFIIIILIIIIVIFAVTLGYFMLVKKSALTDETIKVLPGQSNIILADGESRILFGHSGSEMSVPDVVFEKNYSLNDIHKINYLPIRKELSFYSKGYFITLKNLGCNKETRFTDVPEIWVTDCSINVSSKKVETPILQIKSVVKEINTNSLFKSAISNEPLIYVITPRLSLMHWTTGQLKGKIGLESGSMTSYSTDTPWDMSFITAYGIDTIRYSAEEIFSKQSKKINVGPLQVNSEITSFNCRVIYKGADGGETQQCDDIIVKLTFAGGSGAVKLVNYSE
jgi:hypothetical protein